MNIHLVNPLFLVIALLSLLFCTKKWSTASAPPHTATQIHSQQPQTRHGGPENRASTWAQCSSRLLGLSWISPVSSSARHSAVQAYFGCETCSIQGNRTKAMLSTCRPRLFSGESCRATLALKEWQVSSERHKSWRSWPQKQDSADLFNTYVYTIHKAELLHGEENKNPTPNVTSWFWIKICWKCKQEQRRDYLTLREVTESHWWSVV